MVKRDKTLDEMASAEWGKAVQKTYRKGSPLGSGYVEPIETLGGDKPITDMDMAELWDWLYMHPKFYCDAQYEALPRNLDINYVRVNPDTMTVDDDTTKNTLVDVWLEFGPWGYLDEDWFGSQEEHDRWVPSHDINLDCGGADFEEAFRNLCNLVLEHYGDYERVEYQ